MQRHMSKLHWGGYKQSDLGANLGLGGSKSILKPSRCISTLNEAPIGGMKESGIVNSYYRIDLAFSHSMTMPIHYTHDRIKSWLQFICALLYPVPLAALMKRRNAAVVQAAYHATPVFVPRRKEQSSKMLTATALIDFGGRHRLPEYGHRAPAVIDAIRRQVGSVSGTPAATSALRSYIAVCEKPECDRAGPRARRKPCW